MRHFNAAGMINQQEYNKMPPLHRWDFDEIMTLMGRMKAHV